MRREATGGSSARDGDRRRAIDFFLLVVALSAPFWLLGGTLPLPMHLPTSALMFVAPLVAASILTYRDEGREGLARLLRRVFDHARIGNKVWYLPTLLLLPALFALSYIVMRLLGRMLPEPDVPVLTIPILLVVFFITAAFEEVGYTGYAVGRMAPRWRALTMALAIGTFWGLLHVVPDIQNDHDVAWIAWQRGVYSVALRVLIVWIHNGTGRSLFAAVLFHATDNVSVSLFPNDGSHYDPAVTGAFTAAVAAIVTFLWGARTLATYRFAEPRGRPPRVTVDAPPPGTNGFDTPRLIARPIAPTDASDLFPVLRDERLHAFTGGTPPASAAALRDRYVGLASGGSPDGRERWLNWVLRERGTGLAIGYVQATVVGDDATVAWVVGVGWQGRGYAKEAAIGLVRHLRGLGVRRISAAIHPRHLASEAVARAAGLSLTDEEVDGERVWRLDGERGHARRA
jgi:RimJ/RimL family protein N-acetyltransferase/membrane protease YdiL (CAAX protease family)